MRIAKIAPSGAVAYYLGDHLGSTRKVLDASRNTVFSTSYEPFGKPFAPGGSEAYKYTGEKHDDPTGLVYLRARQYDPEIGRFVSADPVLGSLGMPQTLNRYAYVTNNPLNRVDPSGMSGCSPTTADYLYEACQGFEAWDAFTSAVNAWQIANPNPMDFWTAMDLLMTAVGFVPVIGDLVSTVYFLGRDFAACLTSGCDLPSIGLDALGFLPFVPALGGAVHLARAANRADAVVDVLRAGNRAHDTLLSGYRTVFQRMGLTENVDFFINKGVRFADNPSKIVRGSGRPDLLLRLVDPQTGKGIGIALEIKSQLTRAGRYAEQLLDYERALMRAGYGSYGVRVILY